MSEMEDRMAVFRQRFLARAKKDAASLGAALDERDWAAVRHLAHGLAGNAGLFGFAAIGEEASALEDAVDRDQAEDERLALGRAFIEKLDALPSPD